jgi:hypothetical protein
MYLVRSRIVLSVVPKGKKDQASKATESEAVSVLLRTGAENREEVDNERTETIGRVRGCIANQVASVASLANNHSHRRSHEGSNARTEPNAACANLDQVTVAKRRDADRLRETRSAVGVVQHNFHRRREPV